MTDPVTTLLQLAQPTHGSDVDAWDVPLNANTNLIDQMVGAGIASISLTNVSPVTLTNSQLQNAIIRFTGTITAPISVQLPATLPIQKPWFIENYCVGNFVVTLTNVGVSTLGLPPGEGVIIYFDGLALRYLNLDRIGSYCDYAGTALPGWVSACSILPYLNCDGTTFNATTYPILNQILGGNTLPDLRGRSRAYLNQGTARITAAVSGVDGNTLKAAGGLQQLTIGQSNLPVVNLTFTGNPVTIVGNGGQNLIDTSSGVGAVNGSGFTVPVGEVKPVITPTGSISSFGGGVALGYMPPVTIGGITMIRAD